MKLFLSSQYQNDSSKDVANENENIYSISLNCKFIFSIETILSKCIKSA